MQRWSIASVIKISGNVAAVACRKSDWKLPQVLDTIPWDIIRISVLSIRWSPHHHSDTETKSFVEKMTSRRYKLVHTTDTGKWIFLYNTLLKIWTLTQVNAADRFAPCRRTWWICLNKSGHLDESPFTLRSVHSSSNLLSVSLLFFPFLLFHKCLIRIQVLLDDLPCDLIRGQSDSPLTWQGHWKRSIAQLFAVEFRRW